MTVMGNDIEAFSDLRLNARQAGILEVLRHDRQLGIARLAEQLGVSGETIRRDLRVLVGKGLVEKNHGSVRWRDRGDDQPLQRRMLDNMTAKQAIAGAVARLISDGDSLFLDTGSTNIFVAQALRAHRHLTVVTNSAPIAQHLSVGEGNKVYLAGGELRADDSAAFGPAAIAFLRQFLVKSAIISAAGIDPARGIMDHHLCEAEISRAAIGQADRVIVPVDCSKFGISCLVSAFGFEMIDILVTDVAPADALSRRLEAADVEILLASGRSRKVAAK
jgi:DeoR family transcriptional regulator, glycerol-3-phosphate regulon repressor